MFPSSHRECKNFNIKANHQCLSPVPFPWNLGGNMLPCTFLLQFENCTGVPRKAGQLLFVVKCAACTLLKPVMQCNSVKTVFKYLPTVHKHPLTASKPFGWFMDRDFPSKDDNFNAMLFFPMCVFLLTSLSKRCRHMAFNELGIFSLSKYVTHYKIK